MTSLNTQLLTATFAFLAVVCLGTVSISAAEEYTDAQRAADQTIIETVLRLNGFDLNSSEKGKAAVLRYCRHNVGTPTFFELVNKFQPVELADVLVTLAIEKYDANEGVQAATALLAMDKADDLTKVIASDDAEQAASAVSVLGLTGDEQADKIVHAALTNKKHANSIRIAAAKAIGRSTQGQQQLLEMVKAGELPEEMNFTLANILFASPSEEIRKAAAEHLKLPEAVGRNPLPPVHELVKRRGDIAAGKIVFAKAGTCIKCHKVQGEGKEVGPDLSEIGSKLTREAFYVAILDPSAGISHNYEQYHAYLTNGRQVSGLKISETDEEITIRNAEAIDHVIPREKLDDMEKSKISLMPAGLQQQMTEEQLVDVVEYLTTLKKKN